MCTLHAKWLRLLWHALHVSLTFSATLGPWPCATSLTESMLWAYWEFLAKKKELWDNILHQFLSIRYMIYLPTQNGTQLSYTRSSTFCLHVKHISMGNPNNRLYRAWNGATFSNYVYRHILQRYITLFLSYKYCNWLFCCKFFSYTETKRKNLTWK